VGNTARPVWRSAVGGEAGAALVEFALILPAFVALAFGTLTGGVAFGVKQDITAAAREGARYGARLPVATSACPTASGATDLDRWLNCVADLTVNASSGSLNPARSGRYVCVSYVYPNGIANSDDVTKSRIVTDVGGVETSATDSRDCFTINNLAADGLPPTKRRVEVVTRRTSRLETLVYSSTLVLTATSTTVFEAT
jgi:TadE-like protein